MTLGRKKVLLLDPPRKDVVAAYCAADLFVFGSKIECSPIVLFEAAASRTPFLSSACGNAAEIAEWTGSGRVLAETTPETMARGIEDLLLDKAQLQAMAEAGFRACRDKFTWQGIAKQYEEIYHRLINCRRGSSPRLQ
jgi:glycosyltransferase involved in cell wall biosynthesis